MVLASNFPLLLLLMVHWLWENTARFLLGSLKWSKLLQLILLDEKNPRPSLIFRVYIRASEYASKGFNKRTRCKATDVYHINLMDAQITTSRERKNERWPSLSGELKGSLTKSQEVFRRFRDIKIVERVTLLFVRTEWKGYSWSTEIRSLKVFKVYWTKKIKFRN